MGHWTPISSPECLIVCTVLTEGSFVTRMDMLNADTQLDPQFRTVCFVFSAASVSLVHWKFQSQLRLGHFSAASVLTQLMSSSSGSPAKLGRPVGEEREDVGLPEDSSCIGHARSQDRKGKFEVRRCAGTVQLPNVFHVFCQGGLLSPGEMAHT